MSDSTRQIQFKDVIVDVDCELGDYIDCGDGHIWVARSNCKAGKKVSAAGPFYSGPEWIDHLGVSATPKPKVKGKFCD